MVLKFNETIIRECTERSRVLLLCHVYALCVNLDTTKPEMKGCKGASLTWSCSIEAQVCLSYDRLMISCLTAHYGGVYSLYDDNTHSTRPVTTLTRLNWIDTRTSYDSQSPV